MLTTKEIKNLRIGDTIYHGNMECRVVGLFKDGLSIESVSNNEDISLRYDDDLSLIPPKTKVKMWEYICNVGEIRPFRSSSFYRDGDLHIDEGWVKIEGSMIEVEE